MKQISEIKTPRAKPSSLSFRAVREFHRVDNIKTVYKIGEVIGKGAYASVHKAINKKTKNACALKVITKKLAYSTPSTKAGIESEI